jgi:chromate transporter
VSAAVWALFTAFSVVSLFAVGGASALIPEFHRQIVENYHLMDDKGFAHSVVLSQLAPGPNMLLVSFIGWQVGGLAGLLVSTFAIVGPPSALAFAVGRVIEARGEAAWVKAVKTSLAPIVVGLTAASGTVTAMAADHDAVSWLLTIGSAAFMIAYKRNPLWVIAAGAGAGLLAFRWGLMPVA